ncbi:hypothetical protein ABZV58_26225 [Nocardia sp. NPDC004654]|uniref:hypothetical protein n=1 Tax=Nocardia sp. NPDC004654 TaxID=3154776 RepID=UPI0033BBF82B
MPSLGSVEPERIQGVVMFERCHSAHEVAYVYRGLGFAVSCFYGRVSLTATPTLGAVAMPAGLGAQVRAHLEEESRWVAIPILSYPRAQREWVFLVGPAWGGKLGEHTIAQLEERGVRILESGQRVWLPMTDHPTGWYWVSQPLNAKTMPSRTSVIAVARQFIASSELAAAWR